MLRYTVKESMVIGQVRDDDAGWGMAKITTGAMRKRESITSG